MTLSAIFKQASKNYLLISKPGIILGNAITTAGGFAMAAGSSFDGKLLTAILIGLSFIIASACIFNNYIDRKSDEKMERTKQRAFVTGMIKAGRAIILAISLGLAGTFLLAYFAHLLAACIALFGFFVYVVAYSFSKYSTPHATLIGSIAGAVPPVVGYCAVSGRIDLGALLLFGMVAMWQMPHFYAIAIFRLEDYTRAGIPVMPIKRGILATKIQMLAYIVIFLFICTELTVFHYTGQVFLIAAIILSLTWIALGMDGFRGNNDRLWARKMFFYSLAVITVLCFTIPF